jgi:hypothetical protein
VLGASGVTVTPDELPPLVFLPGREGSLQVEMQAAPRRFGRIAYPLPADLQAITAELDAGRPVLVLHNYGLPAWPRWHYAVVVGYDPAKGQLLLRPSEMPMRPDREKYLEAAAAFERVVPPGDARAAWDAAIGAWPEHPAGWVGRGTAQYRAGDLDAAAARGEMSQLDMAALHGRLRDAAVDTLAQVDARGALPDPAHCAAAR